MHNPWEEIELDAYERHMSLDSVQQLQAMNALMRLQFAAYPAKTAMILGVAGGNGLEHVDPKAFETVYGVDINQAYLNTCQARYPALRGVFQPIRADLTDSALSLPRAQLLIADLLVEYIGYPHFQNVVRLVKPVCLSCVIQINIGGSFVSDSPYLHVFDCLETVHHQMEEQALQTAMAEIGYSRVLRQEIPLPNGKKLVRLDFR